MSTDAHDHGTFNAIRQFLIAPDRRYRVESRDASLLFHKTGSQFDRRWLVRGAKSFFGDRAEALEHLPRTKLIIGGIACAAAAALLLILVAMLAADTTVPIRRTHYIGIGVLFFMFIFGLVMTIAGIASGNDAASDAGPTLSLSLSDITGATLLPPQSELARRGEPQVARLDLQLATGSRIRLAIPTDSDLETVRKVIPHLAEGERAAA